MKKQLLKLFFSEGGGGGGGGNGGGGGGGGGGRASKTNQGNWNKFVLNYIVRYIGVQKYINVKF